MCQELAPKVTKKKRKKKGGNYFDLTWEIVPVALLAVGQITHFKIVVRFDRCGLVRCTGQPKSKAACKFQK